MYLRSWPGRSGMIVFRSAGFPSSASTVSAISSMLFSTPVPTWYVSPTRPRSSTASMAAQWSRAWIHSRRFSVDAYISSGWSSSALVTKTGITFSGNW